MIHVPAMRFLMVDGKESNAEGGEYQQAVELLYALAYAVKDGLQEKQQADGYMIMLSLRWKVSGGLKMARPSQTIHKKTSIYGLP